MAVNYGQVAIVPKGVWNAETQYKVNNLVEYDGSSYVAKVQPPVGTLPTDTSYWQVSAAGTKKATPDSLGTVMPDGTTTEIKEDGKLSAKTAQQNALGIVKGSDDINVGEDGNLTVNTTFEQATEIANIIAGEAIKSVLGKVSKAIATTMSLDENALLKNMISGIDVNDGNKVPSSAYIHSLVERIGMGTALEGGFDNLTAGLNSVNNNLSNTDERVTQLYSEKITWCGNITDLSTLVSLSQQNKTVYIGYIDWRQTDILPSGSKSGTTICFASNWWIWALSGSKEFFCLTQEAKWEKAPYLLSNDLTDFQNKFFINMTNYTFDDLKKVYTGALPKIGFVGYSGPFTPNGQTGYVLCGGSCALLFSVNGDRYRYNAGIGDTAWVKLT